MTSDGIAVREVLALPAMASARVVAGEAGLERPVRSVNVMEVPDIVDWVRADELLLTTTYPLRDDRAAISELVPRLAERGLAALAIKPARYIETIPDEMATAADRLAFPLLELPPETSFNDIINDVLTVILNRQAARLRRSAEIHDRFTRIVLGGGGPRQIAEALAEAVRRPVFLLDPQGTLLGRSVAPGVPIPAWPLADADGGNPTAQGSDAERTVQPIRVGGELYGAIVVLATEADLGEDERDALEYAATVAALRQVQARAMGEADRRFQAVCLEELVAGQIADRSLLTERAAAFGWDLSTPRAVVLGSIEEGPAGPADATPGGHRHVIAEEARSAFGRGAIVWERSDGIGALVAGSPSSTLRASGAALAGQVLQRLPGLVLSIGIGRPVDDPLDLVRSAREAREAIRIGRWSHGPGVAVFAELGLDRLIASAPPAERAAFSDAVLGPLLERGGGSAALLETLEAYLARRSVAQAARDLYVHYNTLANRLERIEELLGPFRDDPERCLALALALRLRRLPA
jgi:purine catabolism regulator